MRGDHGWSTRKLPQSGSLRSLTQVRQAAPASRGRSDSCTVSSRASHGSEGVVHFVHSIIGHQQAVTSAQSTACQPADAHRCKGALSGRRAPNTHQTTVPDPRHMSWTEIISLFSQLTDYRNSELFHAMPKANSAPPPPPARPHPLASPRTHTTHTDSVKKKMLCCYHVHKIHTEKESTLPSRLTANKWQSLCRTSN